MLFVWSLLVSTAAASCYDHSPAFPVPDWKHSQGRLHSTFKHIQAELDNLWSNNEHNTSSISVELTSATDSLWSYHHTAKVLNETRPGDKDVDGHSLYRIASITKTFTTLAILQLHDQGKLSIEDPVDKYVPELRKAKPASAPWKDISLRILASQLSGIPREFAQSDVLDEVDDPTTIGLPPADPKKLPKCHRKGSRVPCTREELLDFLVNEAGPIFAPNQKSTYSNVNFELLGIVIENVSGLSYEDYIQKHIFDPIKMEESTLRVPKSDEHSVIPAIGWTYWDVDEGALNPTGGIYSSTSDMSKYLRYVLTHYNTLATGVNWLMPASWTGSLYSFYGMPWEIFRTDRILQTTTRPVTFVTKAGGLPGYVSRIIIMEEYGLGLTVLVGGQNALLDKIVEIITVNLLRAAEDLIWQDVQKRYTGSFQVDNYPKLNSSLVLQSSPTDGLVISSFISNGTDTLSILLGSRIEPQKRWKAKLFPTLLYQDEKNQKGEIWMLVPLPNPSERSLIWDDFCMTDVDTARYGGIRVNEIVFWDDEIELPAFRVKMKKVDSIGTDGAGSKSDL